MPDAKKPVAKKPATKKKVVKPKRTTEELDCLRILEESKKQVGPGKQLAIFFVNAKTGELHYNISKATYAVKKRILDEVQILCERDKFKMFYREQTKVEMEAMGLEVVAKNAAKKIELAKQ